MEVVGRQLPKNCILNVCFIVTWQRYGLWGLELEAHYFDFIVQTPNVCCHKNI